MPSITRNQRLISIDGPISTAFFKKPRHIIIKKETALMMKNNPYSFQTGQFLNKVYCIVWKKRNTNPTPDRAMITMEKISAVTSIVMDNGALSIMLNIRSVKNENRYITPRKINAILPASFHIFLCGSSWMMLAAYSL